MSYNIAFIGYNEEQTCRYLEDLAVVNADLVKRFERRNHRVLLKDGTVISGVLSAPDFLHGRKFDQVIVADDRRCQIIYRRGRVLAELGRCLCGSIVPEEFQWQFYDLDADV